MKKTLLDRWDEIGFRLGEESKVETGNRAKTKLALMALLTASCIMYLLVAFVVGTVTMFEASIVQGIFGAILLVFAFPLACASFLYLCGLLQSHYHIDED